MNKPSFEFHEQFDMTGYWWLPETPSHHATGMLTFSPSSARLRLMGGVVADMALLKGSTDSRLRFFPVIHGLTGAGETISLLDSVQAGVSWSNGIVTSEVIPGFIVRGAHLDPKSGITFDQINFRLDFLEDWIGITGVSKAIELDSKHQLESIKCQYKLPSKIDFDSSRFCLSFAHGITYRHDPAHEFHLSETLLCAVEPHTSLSINELLRQFVKPVRNLLSLAVGSPTRILKLSVRKNGVNLAGVDPEDGVDYRLPLEIVCPLKQVAPQTGKPRVPPFTLFALGELGEKAAEAVVRWVEASERIDVATDSFFGAIHSDHLSLQQQFRAYVSSLETYHRRTRKNYVMEPKEHELRVKSVLDSLPPEYSEWVHSRIQYGNEPSLAVRLLELITEVEWCFEAHPKKLKEIVRFVVDTRNWITHFDPGLEIRAAKGESLFFLIRMLHWILVSHFLNEAVDDWEKVRGFVMRNQDFLFFKHHQLPELLERVVIRN